jgi:hypothetical protein
MKDILFLVLKFSVTSLIFSCFMFGLSFVFANLFKQCGKYFWEEISNKIGIFVTISLFLSIIFILLLFLIIIWS